MRKILSGFLATAMVASVCTTAAFAAAANRTSFTIPSLGTITVGDNIAAARLTVEQRDTSGNLLTTDTYDVSLDLTAPDQNGDTFVDWSTADLAGLLSGTRFNNVEIDGRRFDITLRQVAAASNTLNAQVSDDVAVSTVVTLRLQLLDDGTPVTPYLTVVQGSTFFNDGQGKNAVENDLTADIETAGNLSKFDVGQVIVVGPEGDPLPLTENPSGVDKDLNSDQGVQGAKTLYFMIQDSSFKFQDDTYWKMKITKGDNGKYVKAVSDVTKTFKGDLYNALNGARVPGTGGTRHRYVKVELNDIYTDDEYKITLDMRLSPKSKACDVYNIDDDTEIKIKDFYFYMKNMVKDADNDWVVGIDGLMLNPLENDWNEVTYYDEDGDVAFMKFFADSDVGKFYSKLSTKWPHEDYAAYFNDQDAFLFQFTGSPKISATSRCDLQIYNPFIDDDGNETVDPTTAVIYQIVDGDLYEVTDQFEYKEGNNGDMAFCTRTRFLGTYVICEKAIAEAAAEEELPEELTPDTNAGAPSEVPVDNGGGKAPANTGRYL